MSNFYEREAEKLDRMGKWLMIFLCVVLAVVIVKVCFFNDNAANDNAETSVDTVMVMPESQQLQMLNAPVAKEFVYKGHQYIKFGSKSGGVVHNPDCYKCNKTNQVNADTTETDECPY